MMESSPDIVQAFGPPPDGLDITESSVAENNAAVIILAALATLAVALRLYTRFLQGHGLHPDDWTIILSLLLVGATVGLSILGGSYGTGNHIWSFTLPELKPIFKFRTKHHPHTFSTYPPTSQTDPLCVYIHLRLLLRRHENKHPSPRALHIPILQALPRSGLLSLPSVPGDRLGDDGERLQAYRVLLGPILKLQMSGRKKLAVCGVMLLGSLVCVASVLRNHHLHTFTQSPDLTRQMGPVFIWSAIEPAVAIASACLPHLAPVVRNKLSSTQRSGGPSAGSTPWRSSKSGTESQKGGALFTIGGSRFSKSFGGDGRVKIGDEEDEIGLTERGAARSGKSTSGSRKDKEEDITAK
ncbi:pth11-like integral membrane protein [Colletotrichum sojae]|uniref:Pth11-like integral membrane protein n=1 Tax=Colletotrichum sojae TaxID=2175907 RepID=A0A8H6JYL4_9PEZI|nr:pth11-like integral membrane protein [Colletotrichum sojae]